MKRLFFRLFILVFVAFGCSFILQLYFFQRQPPQLNPAVKKEPPPKNDLMGDLNTLLKQGYNSNNQLEIPTTNKTKRPTPPTKPKPTDKRAKGRQEREHLPLGVVLKDQVQVFRMAEGKKALYTMKTGDFVRVFSKKPDSGRLQIQPGVDIYLAATSKQYEAAGNRLPDISGWVNQNDLHIFKPEQAVEFTQKTTPITLGTDPDFSTLAFYDRAMRNPDIVVHRVVGPRLISVLSVHEDYDVGTWRKLYRDYDSKIRSVTLSTLRQRGVGNNRDMIEDLIKRLAELTWVRARGETEIEVLTILNILKDSAHPRVPVALQSFEETWKKTQSRALIETLQEIIK